MVSMTVELRSVDTTEAALGWAGGHTIVVDRPEGKAGGRGLGFNGAQLLGFAIGGCFCNDLRYVAHDAGLKLGSIAITVTVELDGDPLLMTGATMTVACDMLDGSDAQELIAKTTKTTMVTNSIRNGVPVTILNAGLDGAGST
ncbi:OsmC family protein [Aurantimonas sp. HBX-1]|uniref:OsmC family protein n=1 Tax=Aurantimonas sp. HBX-1 TaxID=2906072 RepID=UPI001F329DBA|nr:OsmC family protein [Aurantimonas sp. HBX-1]UIJ70955.1 OsmC family protein [Aurantimonas sp. HBX-1]